MALTAERASRPFRVVRMYSLLSVMPRRWDDQMAAAVVLKADVFHIAHLLGPGEPLPGLSASTIAPCIHFLVARP